MGGRLTHWLLVSEKSIKILEVGLHLCWCIDHQSMGGRCYTLAVGASEVHQNMRGRLTSWLLVHRKSIRISEVGLHIGCWCTESPSKYGRYTYTLVVGA